MKAPHFLVYGAINYIVHSSVKRGKICNHAVPTNNKARNKTFLERSNKVIFDMQKIL